MEKKDTNERYICVLNGKSHSFNFNFLLGIKLIELYGDGYQIQFVFIDNRKIEMNMFYSEFIIIDYTQDEYVKLPYKETKEKYLEILKNEIIKYHEYLISEWVSKKKFCDLNDFIEYNGKKIRFTINVN